MTCTSELSLPSGFDWQAWVDRWDRMQKRYLVLRAERFELMVRLIKETQKSVKRVLDLGCGPGSTMRPILEAFPEAQVIGVDLDPTLLPFARARLAKYGNRVSLILADLREPDWSDGFPLPLDAVVSATALHWLSGDQLAALYSRLAQIIRPGAIFLNADHVRSESPAIQQAWEDHREEMRRAEGYQDTEDWDGFWDAYGQALGMDVRAVQRRALGEYGGEELPLSWHLDRLRASGFTSVDCFWRCDCDAVYGGLRA